MSSVTETPVPATTAHDTAAASLLTQMRDMVQNIRGYGFTSLKHRRRMSASTMVSTSFLLSAAVALDASEPLRRAAEATGDQIRDVVNFCNAYGPMADEVILRATGLQQTVQAQRDEAVRAALRAYRIARSFNSPSDRDVLVPTIADMKRTLGRGRKKVVKAPAPVTEPAPAAEPAKRS